jgi:TIR domain
MHAVVESHVSKTAKRGAPAVDLMSDKRQTGATRRASIDRGLANSRFGIVVFSKAFLRKKHWTEHELNGLFAKERGGRKVILPIWHKITDKELLKYSPAFADRVAMISKKDSISDIVRELKRLLGRG